MYAKILIMFTIFSIVAAKIEEKLRRDSNSEIEAYPIAEKMLDPRLTTTLRPAVSDTVVERFVETLLSSEKYLRKIEAVERKITHLDASYHENTDNILRYLSELINIINTSSSKNLLNTLRSFKSDIEKMKTIVRYEDHPSMRDGLDYHADTNLDTRLSIMESEMKNIQMGVDSIVATISEVKNRQTFKPISSSMSTKTDTANVDAMALITEFRRTIREGKKKCEYKSGRVDRSERYPTDCHEIQMQGFNISGIYKIRPEDMEPFYVLCDLTTAGGGWTVFQNRFDGSQDFYKSWHDYEFGFGNLAGEFWLGLEKLNYLTNQKLYELRIEMETHRGQEAFAGYSVFTIGPEREGYRISTLGTFYGTAGDSLSYHAGQKFSTFDIDNDEWKDGACATEHGGAWWYKECDKSNLNGKYTANGEENRGQTIYWISFKGPDFPLSKTKMMIRPLPASKPLDYTEKARKPIERTYLRPYDKLTQNKSPRLHGENIKYNKLRYEMPRPEDGLFPNYT